jgi:hypothetical protein
MAGERDAGGDAAAMRAARMHAQAQKNATPREVRLVAHSNILYWWIVWLYGYVCAFATYINNVSVPFEAKQLKFFPEAWLDDQAVHRSGAPRSGTCDARRQCVR